MAGDAWYYAKDGRHHGPISAMVLKQLAATGTLQPDDLVWKEGLSNWATASSVRGLQFASISPPSPPPPRAVPNSPSSDGLETVTTTPEASAEWKMLVNPLAHHLGRAFTVDLQEIRVSATEKPQLEVNGFVGATSQRYLAWRCSFLFIVSTLTFVSAILSTFNFARQDLDDLTALGSFVTGMHVLTLYALPVAALIGAVTWLQVRLSHGIVLIGWAIAFLVPLLLALFPVEWMIEDPYRELMMDGADTSERAQLSLVVGFFAAIAMYITLLPTVLSLIPGGIRACLRLKTLMPGSILPGWLVLGSAPLFALFLFVIFVSVNQFIGNLVLMIGMMLLLIAPLLYLIRPNLLVLPLTSTRHRKSLVQWQFVFLATAGLGLMFVLMFCLTRKVGGVDLVGLDEQTSMIRPWQILELFLEYIGRSFYITAFVAPLVLWATVRTSQTTAEFSNTDNAASQSDDMKDLHAVVTRFGGGTSSESGSAGIDSQRQ